VKVRNYLSIDVEDYFQVSAFEGICPPERWDSLECRVEANTERILDILDENQVKATFFVLGWIARRYPELVRKIVERGHELASHGFNHLRVNTQERLAFREDIRSSKKLLEDLSGVAVFGYRAPSYSISKKTLWAYDELVEAGYLYDSSVFPVRHDYYGIADWPRFAFFLQRLGVGQWRPLKEGDGPGEFLEMPVTTLRLAGKNIPVAGGGYFRLFPYAVTNWAFNRINALENQPFLFYLHPWEIDPDQPYFEDAGWKSRLRHYVNLHLTEERMQKLLRNFCFGPIRAVLDKPEMESSLGRRGPTEVSSRWHMEQGSMESP
jgi:polysaccharide deacetylase family protein (PEP-CTERM system associated)